MRSRGVIGGFALVLIGLILLAFIIPDQIANREGFYFTPRQWPQVLSILLIICGVIIAWENWSAPAEDFEEANEDESEPVEWTSVLRVIAVPIVVLVYAQVLFAIGYLLTTIAALAILLLIFGVRRIPTLAGISIGFPLALWFLFQHLVGLRLPPGVLAWL